MSGDDLATAFEAVMTGYKVYPGDVPKNPTYPYVFVLTNFPTVAGRAVNRQAQYRHLRARTTVVGLTADSVRKVAQKLNDSLEGCRLTVEGWTLGAVESVPNDQPLLPDRDIVLPGATGHPLYQPFDWILTGSET